VHFQRRYVDQVARTDELLVQVMIPQDMADVLTEEAFDTLAELLHSIDVRLGHAPGAVGASGARGVNGLMPFFTRKFQDTSVTRSRIGGKLRMGSTVTGFSNGRSLSRVMHMSGAAVHFGEQEPHLPALQFHRTARSLACSAWI